MGEIKHKILSNTVVIAYINTTKTTFDFNFDLYQALKQHGYHINMTTKWSCQLKNLLFNYLLFEKSLNKKVAFL